MSPPTTTQPWRISVPLDFIEIVLLAVTRWGNDVHPAIPATSWGQEDDGCPWWEFFPEQCVTPLAVRLVSVGPSGTTTMTMPIPDGQRVRVHPGDCLHVTWTAEVVWHDPNPQSPTKGST